MRMHELRRTGRRGQEECGRDAYCTTSERVKPGAKREGAGANAKDRKEATPALIAAILCQSSRSASPKKARACFWQSKVDVNAGQTHALSVTWGNDLSYRHLSSDV
jgi:hypothetical protein